MDLRTPPPSSLEFLKNNTFLVTAGGFNPKEIGSMGDINKTNTPILYQYFFLLIKMNSICVGTV